MVLVMVMVEKVKVKNDIGDDGEVGNDDCVSDGDGEDDGGGFWW